MKRHCHPLFRPEATSARPVVGGFSLLEVMVSVVLAGVLAATVAATFRGSLDEQARSKHEWQGFTIAQQQMELLASLPRTSSLLSGNSPLDATNPPGSPGDIECASVASPQQHFRTNELGVPTTSGVYELCWKITDGHPTGSLKNIRVIVLFRSSAGSGNVVLQTVR